MRTANKGEWSELYVFLKVLSDQKLFPGDGNLNTRPGHFYPVIQIRRTEKGVDRTYTISPPNVLVSKAGAAPKVFPITSFSTEAAKLLKIIKSASGTFSAPSAEAFFASVEGTQIKADSGSKADILIQIHDFRTNMQPVLGFSIKSKLGSASTLLNAGRTTNLIFELKGRTLSAAEIASINAITTTYKIRDRIAEIFKLGLTVEYKGFEHKTFKNNLFLIDAALPEIIAQAVLKFNQQGISSLAAITVELEKHNPLGFDQSESHEHYRTKLKRFLSEVALGMVPSKVWNGKYNGTEGYIVVKTDGELVCYHIIEKNLFEDYLLSSTKLETASSDRHGFGKVYADSSGQYINLNLQVRFL